MSSLVGCVLMYIGALILGLCINGKQGFHIRGPYQWPAVVL